MFTKMCSQFPRRSRDYRRYRCHSLLVREVHTSVRRLRQSSMPAVRLTTSVVATDLSTGLQLMAKQWQEASLLRAARVLELSAAVTQRNSQSR